MAQVHHPGFDALLRNLLSANNAIRNQSEKEFEHLRVHNPNELIVSLVYTLHSIQDLRTFSAILLRRVLTRDEKSIYYSLSQEVRIPLKAELLRILVEEPNESIRKKVGDTISGLGLIIIEDGEWPELLPFLFTSATQTQDSVRRENCLLIFSSLSYYVGTQMKEHLPKIIAIFDNCLLETEPMKVRIAAFQACVLLLVVLEKPSEKELFNPLANKFLILVQQTLSSKDCSDQLKQQCLELLIMTCETKAAMFRSYLVDLVQMLTHVASFQSGYSYVIRMLAMEVLISMAESSGALVRKMQPPSAFLFATLPILFSWLLEMKDFSPKEFQSWSIRYDDDRMKDVGRYNENQNDNDDDLDDLDDHESSSHSSLVAAAEEYIDRLAEAFKAKKTIPVAFFMLGEYLGRVTAQNSNENLLLPRQLLSNLLSKTPANEQPDMNLLSIPLNFPTQPELFWKVRVAVFKSLAQLLEIMPKREALIAHVVKLTSHFSQDQDPRVRDAALATFSRLGWDCGDSLTSNNGNIVIPCLLQSLDDQVPRIQAHACFAILSFCDNSNDSKEIKSFLSPLITKLFDLLGRDMKFVQESALIAIASVFECAGKEIRPFYSTSMPILMNIFKILQDRPKEYRIMQVRALDCMSILLEAVGAKIYGQDAFALANMAASIRQDSDAEDTGDVRHHIVQSWRRLGQCLGSELAPFLPNLMPQLLEVAAKEISYIVPNYDENNDAAFVNDLSEDGNQDIEELEKTRTEEVEDKLDAVILISSFLRTAGEAFFPFLHKSIQVLGDLINPKLMTHDDIRSSAIASMPDFVSCCAKHWAEHTPETKYEQIGAVLEFCILRLLEGLEFEESLELIKTEVQAIQQCVTSASTYGNTTSAPITSALLDRIFDMYLKQLKESMQRRAVWAAGKQIEEDLDDEKREELEREIEEEHELHFIIADAIGRIIDGTDSVFISSFNRILSEPLKDLTHVHRLPSDRRFAVFIYDDMIENLPPREVGPLLPTILPILWSNADVNDVNLQQACVYGLGICATTFRDDVDGSSHFFSTELCGKNLECLVKLLQLHQSGKYAINEFSTARDNIISSIAKLVLFCQSRVDPNHSRQFVDLWLQNLPLSTDLTESMTNSFMLLELAEQNSPKIFGNIDRKIKVAHILIKVVGTEHLSETHYGRALNVIKGLKSLIPDERFNNEVLAGIDPQHLQLVQKFATEM